MFRRLLRRVPVASAGHESPTCSDDSINERKSCSPDMYHALLASESPIRLVQEDISKYKWKLPRLSSNLFRKQAHGFVLHIRQDERNAARAWMRLRQLYAVFEAMEGIALEEVLEPQVIEKVLLHRGVSAQATTLQDFQELTSTLPEGFTSQMFTGLGRALFDEMIETEPRISRESFEQVGNCMETTRSIVTVVA